MKEYNVSGMSCAACSARVEKAVSSLDGVTFCSVNLLTASMRIDGNISDSEIISAVEKAGYGASIRGEKKDIDEKKEKMSDKETLSLLKRLLFSLVFLAALMYISMGHVMLGLPLPSLLSENPIAVALSEMLLAILIMVINQKFFISGYKGIINRSPNMDTLVSLGSSAAFIYSTAILFIMTEKVTAGDIHSAHMLLHSLYFEASAMILSLITLGKMLEARAKGKTTNALKELISLSPVSATVIRDNEEISIPAEDVKAGDIFIVRPGEAIPVDGSVIEGSSAVNEASLTGESMPSDKKIGDNVFAATVNGFGYIKCKATHTGEDTSFAKIIKTVKEASESKAPIAKLADKVSGIFVPTVLVIAALTMLAWLILDKSIGFALARGISVLVISCPCALGLATPVAIMVGSGKGAKNGILFKTALSLEKAGETNTVVFDKTGTLTTGKPRVSGIVAADGEESSSLLSHAYSLESKSEHPIASAICEHAEGEGSVLFDVSEFEIIPGRGLHARLGDKYIRGGNISYISEFAFIGDNYRSIADSSSDLGETPVFFAVDDKFIGIITVADSLREDAREAVSELKAIGIRTVMLTGDNERSAKAIGNKAGIDEIFAGVLPTEKASKIAMLREKGAVAMVGDGINDAPALTIADTGIAIGAGTDVAIDSADVVLMKSSVRDVPAAIRLSRSTLRIIKENLFWAFIYNIIGIPLAAGAFISLLGWEMNPMIGAAAMSLSSFFVVTNALRLNTVDIYGIKKSKKNKNKIKKEKRRKDMTKIMKIEGMMCMHCEARVKKILEALPEVEAANVSHESGTATLSLNAPVSDEKLKSTVEDEGYKVTEISWNV